MLEVNDLYLTKSTTKNTPIYRYKASLAQVFPTRLRSSLSEYHTCVFGISLGSKNFVKRERLEACIKWISANFPSCLVLVCDSIYRLTIEVREGVKEEGAWLEALRAGEEFVKENYELFEQYSERCKFKFEMASEIAKQSEFNRYYQELQTLHSNNESFQRMVNSFAQKYLNRGEGEQLETEPVDEHRQHLELTLAITYLLEESALIAYFINEGWQVFVYPGSIKTFEEMSEGLHPEIPEPLKKMIWVSLRLKKCGAISE
ncbi:MAG: tRNA-dependent cyclodipeptide synthase [Symploca sp. SIO3E6]|nr:tRNA-dependent cyclodipeptide synthase [Caldora sp. SIO3E6]